MAKGISEEEFSQLQNQFLELKSVNYGLEDKNRKHAAALAELESRLRRTTAEATRLQSVVDKSRRARDTEQLVAANFSLEKKLADQEDEFRLQNQTLLQELASYVSENERLTSELAGLRDGRPDTGADSHSDELLRLRAELAALRQELSDSATRASAELAELRQKATALTDANIQLERACRPPPDSTTGPEDCEFVEVGGDGAGGEVCYHRAAATAHELLRAAEERVTQLQTDIQQFADMRLELETARRELELSQQELRRQRDYSSSGGEPAELRQKLSRKQESYQALQAEMETLRQTLEAEVAGLKEARQREAEDARSRTQRYQTQLNNGYSVLKAEREQAAATILALKQQIARLEAAPPGAAGDFQASTDLITDAAPDPDQAEMVTDLQTRLTETEARLTEAESRLTEAEAAREQSQGCLTEVRAEAMLAETRHAETGERLRTVESELAEMKTKLSDTETALAEATTARDDAQALAGKRKSVLNEMAAHIEYLTSEHAEQLRKANEAGDHAQTLADARADKLQELESAVESAELAQLRAADDLQAEQQRLQQLQRRLEQLQTDHADQLQLLKHEAEQLRRQHAQETEAVTQRHQAELKDVSTQLEISSALLAESREKAAALRQEVKDSVDEKRIHERKGAAVVKDLRRQLAQERRRAEKLQQALQEAPLSAAATGPGQNASVSPPPEDAQSVSSWSLMSGENGIQSAASATGSAGSPVDTETVSLLARITRLQEEKWRVEEKLNHLEENSGALADDLASKAALVQFYCMEGRGPPPSASGKRRDSKTGGAEAAVVAPVKKLVDFVKHLSLDEQQREVQRRMQRMLEETLTRNMHLQQDLQVMSEQLQTLRTAQPVQTAQTQLQGGQ